MTTKILIGDVIEKLHSLPDESVHCVVTSPPYWGLRDYGIEGQIGLEPTLGEHITKMVEVFREVKRVLRADGTCWVNYGDCYATTPNGRSAADTKAAGTDDRTFRDKPFSTVGPIIKDVNDPAHICGKHSYRGDRTKRMAAGGYLKPKDLCMIPNRLAIALQDDGWWVRSEIIWHKTNPMPESITDRPAGSHEKVWLLTKSERYFYDADAVLQPVTGSTHARVSQNVAAQIGSTRANGGGKTNGNMKAVVRAPKTVHAATGSRNNQSFIDGIALIVSERNLRNVWSIPTAAFSEAHFATFPPALVRPCIQAGTSVRGVCPACQAPFERVTRAGTTLGFKPTCSCEAKGKWPKLPKAPAADADDEAKKLHAAAVDLTWDRRLKLLEMYAELATAPATVLDPFGGAGTTALVAAQLQRNAVLIELNPEYARMARKRIREHLGRVHSDMPEDKATDLPLFTDVRAAE